MKDKTVKESCANKDRICVLVSGGLDSSILLGLAARKFKKVFPLYVRCGLSWEKSETYWLRKFLKKLNRPVIQPLEILDLSLHRLYQTHWSMTGKNVPDALSRDEKVYLPGRNILLLSQASIFCSLHKIGVVALGVLKGNPFPDSQNRFFRSFEKVVRQGLHHSLKILAPFSELSKQEVLDLGKGLPIECTLSCLKPRGFKACGDCNKCAEKGKLFRL